MDSINEKLTTRGLRIEDLYGYRIIGMWSKHLTELANNIKDIYDCSEIVRREERKVVYLYVKYSSLKDSSLEDTSSLKYAFLEDACIEIQLWPMAMYQYFHYEYNKIYKPQNAKLRIKLNQQTVNDRRLKQRIVQRMIDGENKHKIKNLF